jgi:hypothetical protein
MQAQVRFGSKAALFGHLTGIGSTFNQGPGAKRWGFNDLDWERGQRIEHHVIEARPRSIRVDARWSIDTRRQRL